MPRLHPFVFSTLALLGAAALAQEATVLRDLEAAGRVTLTKDELGPLLAGAKMSRISGKGNTHFWKHEADGTFIISSDNRDRGGGRPTTAQGKWNISDDGRYCVLIEWKTNPTEEWCRYIVKSGADYYGTRSDKTATEKVYKLMIAK
jgi:Protein of unknown function (DUF995)